MNRIETRIVIIITNRLAAAEDSDAKTEMIEELSENLYQRYLELAESGMSEEAAFDKAMESLGDVEELLAFLRETEAETEEAKEDYTFTRDDLENGIEEIVNAALSTAKVAVDCAKDVAKDVSEQLKTRYQDGVFTKFSSRRGQKVDCRAIPSENLVSLEIHLTNGSIHIRNTDGEYDFVEIAGETEEIETVLKEDGLLSITQGNTASAAYFFTRGMRRSDIEIRLPKKFWNQISITTVNGDIMIEEGLRSENLTISTTSGNVVTDQSFGSYTALRSCSGDIRFCGESKDLDCSSTSGNVQISLPKMPEKTKGNSISGDCEVRISQDTSFRLFYRTVSGKFETDVPLTGSLGEKCGNAVYGNGDGGEIQLSSVSGKLGLGFLE